MKTHWSEAVDLSRRIIGQRIARAARAFDKRRTKHGRKWVAVFMNEDTGATREQILGVAGLMQGGPAFTHCAVGRRRPRTPARQVWKSKG